ncbi:MAG: class I SAM-dependent methyltransferase [Actinomycetota bacterium]|nr:class I SAM-dependent methyltransferase [Actinomycetota bacterium]
MTRDLTSRGHEVTAIDASPTMTRYADDHGAYVVADAASLPFPAASFDLAIAHNSLMDVDDMPAAVAETARVLQRGGRLCVCITHPINDAGAFSAREAGAPFIISGQYLEPRTLDETLSRAGLEMRFHSKGYPLEDYSCAFEAAGMVIENLREPAADAGAVARDPSEHRWQRLPMFLQLRLLKQ